MDPEIEELKAQVASLQEQLAALAFAREDASSGGGEVPTHFFPIGQMDDDGEEFLHPFEVRWSPTTSSQYSQDGAWVVWIPDSYKLAMCDGEYVNITGIAAAQGMDSGWYTVSYLGPTATTMYLIITVNDSDGTVEAHMAASAAGGQSGYTTFNVLVAKMSTGSEGEKGVVQLVDSAVIVGTSEDGVTPDGVSTEFIPDPPAGTQPSGDEGKLQVKGWKTGTPTSSTTVAQDIASGGGYDKVLVRDNNGVLKYKSLGALSALLGSGINKSNQKIITGISWDATNHYLVISSAQINVTNGLITSWTNNPNQNIETTAISSILGS